MSERRYSEDEVAAIFEWAAKEQHTGRRQLPPGQGMTLAELQEIGRDVGLPAELVAQGALAIEKGGRPTSRKFLGLPIGVGRTIEFDRRLTDEEWEQLVGDLRQTFDARGHVRYDGPFRQWTDGNLEALLEPTPSGHRLLLRTYKGNARGLMLSGLAVAGITLAMGVFAGSLAGLGAMVAIGLGIFGVGAAQLPGWARQRRGQMEAVAERLALTAGTGPKDVGPSGES
jgi:hypothetical protein